MNELNLPGPWPEELDAACREMVFKFTSQLDCLVENSEKLLTSYIEVAKFTPLDPPEECLDLLNGLDELLEESTKFISSWLEEILGLLNKFEDTTKSALELPLKTVIRNCLGSLQIGKVYTDRTWVEDKLHEFEVLLSRVDKALKTPLKIKYYEDLTAQEKLTSYMAIETACRKLADEFLQDPGKFEKLVTSSADSTGFVEGVTEFIFSKCDVAISTAGRPVVYVPINNKFRYAAKGDYVVNMMTRELTSKSEVYRLQRKAVELKSDLIGKDFKTPRQFAEDCGLPLREVNRCVKKGWAVLQNQGSLKLDFPGADPLILLSPKAQDHLKIFTPKGKPPATSR
jgi:hypothetical protein